MAAHRPLFTVLPQVYTVGPRYAHAEARKAPTLDGKVVRNESGKTERYPVTLYDSEREIARKVVKLQSTFDATNFFGRFWLHSSKTYAASRFFEKMLRGIVCWRIGFIHRRTHPMYAM